MRVIKRDGRIVPFEINKIHSAIIKAFSNIADEKKYEVASAIAEEIRIDFQNKDSVTISEIESKIIAKLNKRGFKKVAKDYKDFRDERTKVREKTSSLITKIMARINAEDVENANANVDERSFSGKEKEASADVQKFMAIDLENEITVFYAQHLRDDPNNPNRHLIYDYVRDALYKSGR
jgi:ribonucleoside-triphosphate reductase